MSQAPIGIFDSGVGGLSVWRQVVHHLPGESVLYLADQAHVPYGNRSAAEIQGHCLAIADHLVQQGCKAIVVACNTASAVALAQPYPTKPVKLVVGFTPGGGVDIAARTLGPKLSEIIGQNIIVENMPGAGTNIEIGRAHV